MTRQIDGDRRTDTVRRQRPRYAQRRAPQKKTKRSLSIHQRASVFGPMELQNPVYSSSAETGPFGRESHHPSTLRNTLGDRRLRGGFVFNFLRLPQSGHDSNKTELFTLSGDRRRHIIAPLLFRPADITPIFRFSPFPMFHSNCLCLFSRLSFSRFAPLVFPGVQLDVWGEQFGRNFITD